VKTPELLGLIDDTLASPAGRSGCPVYLAAAYGRRHELRRYAEELWGAGFIVTSSWIDSEDDDDERLGTKERVAIAHRDLDDLRLARYVVAFTEGPSGPSRGGRHVELGFALALGRRVIIVGPAENVYCDLADAVFPTWQAALAHLREVARSIS